MKSFKNECLRWAQTTFDEQLNQIADSDNTEIISTTKICFDNLKILNKHVDGYASEGLEKTSEGKNGKLKNYTDIFHEIEESDFTPARYLYQLVKEYIDAKADIKKLNGFIARGLRTLTSLMREPDFAERIQLKLLSFDKDTVAKQCPKQDAGDHTDVLLNFKGKVFRIWLFQFSDNGLPHDIDRLTERRGVLPEGIHILCPLKTELADKYNKLRLKESTLIKRLTSKQNEIAKCKERQVMAKEKLTSKFNDYQKGYVKLSDEMKAEKTLMEEELEIVAGWYFYSEKYLDNVCAKLNADEPFDIYKEVKDMLMKPREYLNSVRWFEK